MSVDYLVTSFIEIARHVSDNNLICDAQTNIHDLFSDDFDILDFETSLYCFEATHRVTFHEQMWEADIQDYQNFTIEKFIETFCNPGEQRDPLFVTQRFLLYKETLIEILNMQDEDGEGKIFND